MIRQGYDVRVREHPRIHRNTAARLWPVRAV